MADLLSSTKLSSIQQLLLKNLGNQIFGKINPHVLQPVNIDLRGWILKIFVVLAKVLVHMHEHMLKILLWDRKNFSESYNVL